MARIRSIKPEFQNSGSMGRVSRDARLTFILLWPQCDDAGRIRGDTRMLASVLYPYDEDAKILIEGWLTELENEGCIVRYEHAKDKYLAVINFFHQKIDRPSPSKLPPPPEQKKRKSKPSSREKSANDTRESDEASRSLLRKGRDQGEDQEEEVRAAPQADAVAQSPVVIITPSEPEQKRALRKTALPDNFPFQDDIDKALAFWSESGREDLSALLEYDKFRAHHTAHGSRMANWPAAWRTWFHNALKFNKREFGNGPRGRPSRVDNAVAGAGRFLEEAGGSTEDVAGRGAGGRTVVARAVHGPTAEADDHPRANGSASPSPGRDLSLADAFARSDDAEIPGLLRGSAAPLGG